MTELQRYRAHGGTLAPTMRRFLRAIEDSADAPDGARRRAAAIAYRLDPALLDVLHGAGMADMPPAELSRIKAALPDIVRQVARIAAGLPVATLGLDAQGQASTCGVLVAAVIPA
ncbi:hypothetical protein O0880_07180 [Janthinobacterium sp. SUN118]|uniref:hypothetical protein n=1 Tax=Janthinobacterium sp. SUN118 TaxID=3004100 RepID=UPI0025AF1AE0|nr:hypothetical protein [Janthinobacterium sp. SUN118]MDN2709206.1 hypothetical protein [Janthinobacterium sp. SUN118]